MNHISRHSAPVPDPLLLLLVVFFPKRGPTKGMHLEYVWPSAASVVTVHTTRNPFTHEHRAVEPSWPAPRPCASVGEAAESEVWTHVTVLHAAPTKRTKWQVAITEPGTVPRGRPPCPSRATACISCTGEERRKTIPSGHLIKRLRRENVQKSEHICFLAPQSRTASVAHTLESVCRRSRALVERTSFWSFRWLNASTSSGKTSCPRAAVR